MLKNLLIYIINKRYAGKELWFCNRIYEDIAFMPRSVNKCCHSTKMPYSPPFMYEYPIEKFNIINYITKIDYIMHYNQTGISQCRGCRFFVKQTVPAYNIKESLKFITINHFTKCNSNCVYCAIKHKTEDIKFHLLPILKQMIKQKMINKDVLFNWGGGEPVLCSEFEEIAKYLHSNNFRQAINSSGIIFSDTILKGMQDGSMSVQISPDSGTEETYFKIKRQNNFNKVWENIKKYAQAPDMLFVKYIFFSLSANGNDIREFIKKCKDCGVKNIVIDCESNSANNLNSPFGNINEEILKQAVLMKNLAIENNIKYEISYQWKSEHKKFIEETT